MATLKGNVRLIIQSEEPREIFASKRHTNAKNQSNARIGDLLGLQRLQCGVAVQMLLAVHSVEQLIADEFDFVLRLQAALIQVFQLRLAAIKLVHVVLSRRNASNLRGKARFARVLRRRGL